jgi:hypothetical protein
MKNVVLWDINTKFVPHRRHALPCYRAQRVNAEVSTAATMKNAAFWDTKSSSYITENT